MNDREPALNVGVLSMPVFATTNETIQKFSDVPCETGDKHMGYYFNERGPFVQNNHLFTTANGLIAQQNVNVENAISE